MVIFLPWDMDDGCKGDGSTRHMMHQTYDTPHKQLCYRKTNAANFTKLHEHVYQTIDYNNM